jgi:hypothetical protein
MASTCPTHQPVEQHADRREVLLHRRLGGRRLQRLDIGGDMQRLDVGELADPAPLDPCEELTRGPVISHARVAVADAGGEKFEEAAGGMRAGPQ